MSLEKDELMLLGKMDGKLDGILRHLGQQDKRMDALDAKIDSNHKELDGRLRSVEQKAAVVGAVGGTAAGLGVALIVEGFRSWLRGGGSGG